MPAEPHPDRNLGQMFRRQAAQSGERAFLLHREEGTWKSATYAEVREQVDRLCLALLRLRLRPGERVALLSENRPEWLVTDLAALSLGLVDVPLYATSPTPEVLHILADSGATVLFVSGAHQWEKVRSLRDELPALRHVFSFDPVEEEAGPVAFHSLIGETEPTESERQELAGRQGQVDRGQLASILYTSGTTGEPKGVLLSHGNFLSNCEAVLQHIEIRADDRTLSFLPLSHSFERTAGHYVILAAGGEIAYASSLERVAVELKEVQPTLVLGVPRFFEKIHARILEGVERAPLYRRRLFRWASKVGERMFTAQLSGEAPPLSLRWRHELADRLVFSRLRERIGGRVRLFVSGGAPLDADIAFFFNALGIPLLEGYGLSETSPVVSVNQPGRQRPGTVGTVLQGVQVRIADDGEILVSGPNVMLGYHGNPDATREVLDADGTFHTGDIGELGEDGFLKVTDRKKELIITAGGKNISPQKVEYLLKRERAFADACLIGDRRPYLVALLVPDTTALKTIASEQGWEWKHTAEMLDRPEVKELFQSAVERANRELSSPEQVKRFAVLREPFSQENGELTPTLKVRRRIVSHRYQDLIERLYRAELSHEPGSPALLPG